MGPLLIVIFINYLPNEMTNVCKMFADDTKIIGCPGKSLLDDVDKAVSWGEKWQMQLNANKCEVLHFGKNNTHFRYVLNTCNANASTEKDLGMFFENEYSFQMHVIKTANRANVLVGLIRRSFNYMGSEMYTYKTHSRIRCGYLVSNSEKEYKYNRGCTEKSHEISAHC